MAYHHIDNLYRNQDVLLFKEVYALEKIHGTSAHVSFKLVGTVPLSDMNLGLSDISATAEIDFFSGEQYDKETAQHNVCWSYTDHSDVAVS